MKVSIITSAYNESEGIESFIKQISQNIVKFNKLDILEDSEDGLWVSGISNLSRIIIQGQGFVEDGQEVITEIK